MKFHSLLMYINDGIPNTQTCRRLMEIGPPSHRKGKFLFSVEKDFIADRFLWLYFQYDNERLYTDTVLDTVDNAEKGNPRPKNQVELRFQLFACYDLQRQRLYVNDYNRKTVVADYIADALQVSVYIKNVYTSIDDFLAVSKQLKSATFTQHRTLCTQDPDSIFRKQVNLYGLDLPERSKFHVDYGNSPIGIVKTTLQNLGLRRDRGEFEEIIVVGIDDQGFENSFNFSSMISSVEIEVHRNENDRFEPNSVRARLLGKIGV